MGGDIYSLSPYSGAAGLQELFILENLLEESKNKEKECSHTSHMGVHVLDDGEGGILTQGQWGFIALCFVFFDLGRRTLLCH